MKTFLVLTLLVFGFGRAQAEGKKPFTALENAIVMGVAATSPEVDERTQKLFQQIVGIQDYSYRVSAIKIDCSFNEFAKKSFECTIDFGDDDLDDDDYGWGGVYRTIIFGKWHKNPKKIKIDEAITTLLAG